MTPDLDAIAANFFPESDERKRRCIEAMRQAIANANVEFVQETLRLATKRYEKAESLNEQYKRAILALIDSMAVESQEGKE